MAGDSLLYVDEFLYIDYFACSSTTSRSSDAARFFRILCMACMCVSNKGLAGLSGGGPASSGASRRPVGIGLYHMCERVCGRVCDCVI